jgi:hypothetical protein
LSDPLHPPPDPPPIRLPTIRLAPTEAGIPNVLPADPTDVPFAPFPLPRLPLSLHCWLTGLTAEFRRRHGRCLAALLMLDCRAGHWAQPVLPAQTCGADGAAWTLDPGGERVPAHHRVGGSFQMRRAADLIDACQTLPALDGLHIVQTLGGNRTLAYCFRHAGGESTVLTPEEALEDDWALALAEAAGRMIIE